VYDKEHGVNLMVRRRNNRNRERKRVRKSHIIRFDEASDSGNGAQFSIPSVC